jgi:chromosome segregation ATPase
VKEKAMRKYLLVLALTLSACASNPLDRTESNEEYARQEEENQQASLTRSELSGKLGALESKIKATDSQMKNQRNLIKRWESQSLPSSRAMTENAKLRLEQLAKERAELVKERDKIADELKAI